MPLSPLELAWLMVACGCIVAGAWLTTRRLPHTPTRPLPQPGRCRCGQRVSVHDRFCGHCGRRTMRRARERNVGQEV